MNAPSGPPTPTVHRVGGTPSGRALLIASLLGTAGVIEVTVPFLILSPKLPGNIIDHFGIDGQPNGSLPAGLFMAVVLGTIFALTLVFLALLYFSSRSPALSTGHGARITRLLLILDGTMVVGVLPLISLLLLASASGVWSVTGQGLGGAVFAVGVLPLAAITVALLATGRARLPRRLDSGGAAAPRQAFLGVGGGIELSCSACGEAFQLSGVPLLAPHWGAGGRGSIYMRCPRCGERGWDAVVARG